MNLPPTVKYTLGRVGLFVAVFAVLLLVPGISLLVRFMIAILASAGLQFVVLKKWRAEMIGYIDGAVSKSKAEKAKLRVALAGEESPGIDAAGEDSPGIDAAGEDSPGIDAVGEETPGRDAAGEKTPGMDLAGDAGEAEDPPDTPSEVAASPKRSAGPVTARKSRR